MVRWAEPRAKPSPEGGHHEQQQAKLVYTVLKISGAASCCSGGKKNEQQLEARVSRKSAGEPRSYTEDSMLTKKSGIV